MFVHVALSPNKTVVEGWRLRAIFVIQRIVNIPFGYLGSLSTVQVQTTTKNKTPPENRQGGRGGYFSRPCWARVDTTHEGVGGYFSPRVLGPC